MSEILLHRSDPYGMIIITSVQSRIVRGLTTITNSRTVQFVEFSSVTADYCIVFY